MSHYVYIMSLPTEQSRYKTLKANYDELERGFTAKSEANMRLASELESANHATSKSGTRRSCYVK